MQYRAMCFLGAFLLFALEPMIGKAILPYFGGGAGVWVVCLLFFQLVLLAGYAYAHFVAARLQFRVLRWVQGSLIALAILSALVSVLWGGTPFLPGPGLPGSTIHPPALAILAVLAMSSGLGLLVLSTTSPLAQMWFFRATGDREPYRLYADSNWGSFLGLLSYPLLVEPLLGLKAQSWLVLSGFTVYGAICLHILWKSPDRVPVKAGEKSPAPLAGEASAPADISFRAVAVWSGLAALGTVWLLAISEKLSTDVASLPLMWIPPLALYLLTYVLVFDGRLNLCRRWVNLLNIGVLGLYALFLSLPVFLYIYFPTLSSRDSGLLAGLLRGLQWMHGQTLFLVVFSLAAMLAACLLCHQRLAELRPHPSRLTVYFLAIAGGGALGGVAVSVVAPLLFNQNFELPLAILGVFGMALLGFRKIGRHASWTGLMISSAGIAAALVLLVGGWAETDQRHYRDFFGTVRISQPHRNLIQMTHGNTIHGIQFTKEPLRPAAYFGLNSGIGRVIRCLQAERPGLKVGIIGLGVGNTLAYGRSTDHFVVYEISPKVIRLSGLQGEIFKVASSTPAQVEIQEGDGRILLGKDVAAGKRFDLLLVDAFSGGNIPAHLLTQESLQLYLRSLEPEGVLALHVSHNLPLFRQVGYGLDALGLPSVQVRNEGTLGRDKEGKMLMVEMPSIYWLASRGPLQVFRPEILTGAVSVLNPGGSFERQELERFKPLLQSPSAPSSHARPWMDDRYSLIPLLF